MPVKVVSERRPPTVFGSINDFRPRTCQSQPFDKNCRVRIALRTQIRAQNTTQFSSKHLEKPKLLGSQVMLLKVVSERPPPSVFSQIKKFRTSI